jgi:O-phosphoseryl-tRNA(Cys) synthetase
MEISDEEFDKAIQQLVELGAIEVYGFDKKSGQFTYRLTEKCQEVFPELFEEHFAFINELAFSMWQKGYIEISFDGEGSPVPLLKKEIDYENDLIPILLDDERFFIENLIQKYNGII